MNRFLRILALALCLLVLSLPLASCGSADARPVVAVTIPPEAAYGPEGSGHPLSGRTLVFIIDLISA